MCFGNRSIEQGSRELLCLPVCPVSHAYLLSTTYARRLGGTIHELKAFGKSTFVEGDLIPRSGVSGIHPAQGLTRVRRCRTLLALG
jgi:hypothetical protein